MPVDLDRMNGNFSLLSGRRISPQWRSKLAKVGSLRRHALREPCLNHEGQEHK